MIALALAVIALPFALGALAVLATGIYYTLARAEITRPLWSRYTGVLDRVARCPACSGTWIGSALGTLVSGLWLACAPGGHGRLPNALLLFLAPAALGLCMQVLVPIVLWPMLAALNDTYVPAVQSKTEVEVKEEANVAP